MIPHTIHRKLSKLFCLVTEFNDKKFQHLDPNNGLDSLRNQLWNQLLPQYAEKIHYAIEKNGL